MEKFTTLAGIAAPMMVPNIDTDAIIPVEQMKALDADFGRCLFFNQRYRLDGSDNPDFLLNRPPYRKAKILVAGENFGCGSSREHAVWALVSFGIRCVIAPSFGDIFYNNSFKNGLLPVQLPANVVDALAVRIEADANPDSLPVIVDLEACTVHGPGTDGPIIAFDIDPERREALLEGLDEIGITLKHEAQIAAFQARDAAQRPWVYRNAFLT
ncbi:MAG: 3-isopropylmalate dehydratase small subunit [Betaproteobacteria bacterium]|nr:3-isopropylmalate dehydratase small subunit [Betaproteobacteria bacterium]